jgi:hypothetical protein
MTTTHLHETLMCSAADKASPGLPRAEMFDALTPQERFATCTGNLNYQVENGGFGQWVFNGYATPETVAFLQRALVRMGTPAATEVLRLLNLVADALPENHRREELDHGVDDEACTAYYKVNDAFMVDCEAHLQAGKF